ncbi:hypothetical protein [Thermoactinomyces sp. CICC 10735]|jgi:hypothetical protein|uniref:hypothetical protein n=1 Tax=Thermoactinomyces sp. CICC 10735 TaxID=2767430 RepID=UPI0018DD23B7|nr:hypothetical protein [Thermoactinomyces sp. CICC 10735]MBH8583853.1 hypothetical protein [Thermoactinomyces sp. CICC 10735]
MVAGGDQIHGIRRYHVQYYDAVHRYEANLVNPSESEETKEHLNITVQKVGTDIFKQYLVGYDDMIRAVKHFFETGELTEDQEWE